jgi:hypothetical protein
MDLGDKLKWSNALEDYIKNISEKCMSYGILHKMSQQKYNKYCLMIDIPVIICSTISGSLNIGSEQIFAGVNNANLMVGAVSILVAIMSTISSYFAFNSRMEMHKNSYLNFMKLNRFINIELSVQRSERIIVKDLIKIIRNEYERLMENSPLIDGDIIKLFKKKYKKYYDDKIIAFPIECNGLEPTQIFNLTKNNDISSFIDRINDGNSDIHNKIGEAKPSVSNEEIIVEVNNSDEEQ